MIDYIVMIGEYRHLNCKSDFIKADNLCKNLKTHVEDVHILAEGRKEDELHR